MDRPGRKQGARGATSVCNTVGKVDIRWLTLAIAVWISCSWNSSGGSVLMASPVSLVMWVIQSGDRRPSDLRWNSRHISQAYITHSLIKSSLSYPRKERRLRLPLRSCMKRSLKRGLEIENIVLLLSKVNVRPFECDRLFPKDHHRVDIECPTRTL